MHGVSVVPVLLAVPLRMVARRELHSDFELVLSFDELEQPLPGLLALTVGVLEALDLVVVLGVVTPDCKYSQQPVVEVAVSESRGGTTDGVRAGERVCTGAEVRVWTGTLTGAVA